MVKSRAVRTTVAASLLCLTLGAAPRGSPSPAYDVIIRNGVIYDGTGNEPVHGDVAVKGDRIAAIGLNLAGSARTTIDARGRAVAPGFINMLAHPEVSLFADGRALSDLAQGVTLEVLGEDSMGPLTPAMQVNMRVRQSDIHYPVTWRTLGQYMEMLERRGISPNIASFVGAGTVRTNLLGEADVQPNTKQLEAMRTLVRKAMEEGAVGLTTALIYSPNTYARTPELIALAKVSAQCGGIFSAHVRNEGDRLIEAIDELVTVARASGAPGHIYHFKQSGPDNWAKIGAAVSRVEAARASGTRITADMYTYTASATGLDAAMPPWVQEGGYQAWAGRLKDKAVRAKVAKEMLTPTDAWENLLLAAGPKGTLLVGFRNPELRGLIGKTLEEVAVTRGRSAHETAMDLVVEDGSRVQVVYFLMSEENTKRQAGLPWVSFGSDAASLANEGVFLKQSTHPRAYGNFARLLGKYVREEKATTLEDAIRRLTSLPAANLRLTDRGLRKVGQFADVLAFDAATIADHATYQQPHQYATGMTHVWVNGTQVLKNGEHTGAKPGQVVRGPGYKGK